MRNACWIPFLCLVFANAHRVRATDDGWGRFRGPNGSGVSASTDLPDSIGPEDHLAWKIDIEKGASSPIVTGDRVFLTSFKDAERVLEAFDAKTGERAWRLTMTSEREMKFTPPSGPTTATAVCDGDRVFAFFADAGVLAATTDGRELWRVPMAPPSSMHGIASSLVIAGDKLIVLADQLADSFVAALDCSTGEEVWRQQRFNGFAGGFSTPVVLDSEGQKQVIVFGPLELVAYHADSGERLWWVTGVGNSPVGLPILSGKHVVVSEPVFEPLPYNILEGLDKNKDGSIAQEEHEGTGMSLFLEKIDREHGNNDRTLEPSEWEASQASAKGTGGIAAIELGGRDDVTRTHVRWRYKKQVSYISSVLVYDDVLYMIQDGGLLTTFNPETGEVFKRGRLSQGGGKFWASPVAGDGKVYVVNTEGKLTVLKAGREWEELSFGELGEETVATPALADGSVYVRTDSHLWCFRS